MRVSIERQTELLNQIIEADENITWLWTKDGMGFPMISANIKNNLVDICINYENEIAIVYTVDSFGRGGCKNIPVSLVHKFLRGEIEVINPMEMMFKMPMSSVAKGKSDNDKAKKKMAKKSKKANRK